MDEIVIESMLLKVRIGVNQWEQKIDQTVILDLHLYHDFSMAGDNIAETIDYDALCQHIQNYVDNKSFQLIETLANTIASEVLTNFPLQQVKIIVSKPHALRQAKNVKVIATRSNPNR